MIDRNFVKFLKEQYPKGTRIRLNSMSDPYAPVEPGTEGSVEMVDDAGQLLMKWDNGRTLALIPGEDSFSVLPPKLTTLKLYMPMTVDRFESDGWGGTEDEPTELSNYEAVRYVDSINAALRRESLPAEAERGLMHYYGKNDDIARKVRKVTFSAEVRDQKLWGVAECQVASELTPEELTILKEYVSGQASDGFGDPDKRPTDLAKASNSERSPCRTAMRSTPTCGSGKTGASRPSRSASHLSWRKDCRSCASPSSLPPVSSSASSEVRAGTIPAIGVPPILSRTGNWRMRTMSAWA